jgi:sugar transferase (PEP-CTERM/EpsH1 system associated)
VSSAKDARPLIVHVVYRFGVGGLENGVVNLINHMPAGHWRHAVVALTEVEPDFASRLTRLDVQCISLHKPPGQGVWQYPKLWRTFRQLRPAVVHTRNLAALEAQVPAFMAGVPARVHGEHGRDVEDMHGLSRRHQWMRRAYRPVVQHYVALSRDLATYLQQRIGVPASHITQIYNGVDTERFTPAAPRTAIAGCPFIDAKHWLVGTVGRMQTVKAQPLLARAFVQVLQQQPGLRERLRLVMVGSGPLRAECESILRQGNAEMLAWLPGDRSDVPDVMRGLNCFVLPSLAEGISNTILEAMACALPVVATDVGGNADLVLHGESGQIVPAGDVSALAQALAEWSANPSGSAAAGLAGRAAAERRFSLAAMVSAYEGVYRHVLGRAAQE